jgi:hypothetical protein
MIIAKVKQRKRGRFSSFIGYSEMFLKDDSSLHSLALASKYHKCGLRARARVLCGKMVVFLMLALKHTGLTALAKSPPECLMASHGST